MYASGFKENLDHSRKRENIKFLFIFLLRFNLNGKQSCVNWDKNKLWIEQKIIMSKKKNIYDPETGNIEEM